MSLVLVAGLIAVAQPSQRPESGPGQQPVEAGYVLVSGSGAEPAAADVEAAAIAAVQLGEPVEVADRTSEFERQGLPPVWLTPDL